MSSLLRRHAWRWSLAGAGLVVAALVMAMAAVVPFRSEIARQRIIGVLAARFDADVQLDEVRLRVLPRFRAEGHGLVIRYRGRRDVPPLIAVGRFSAESSAWQILHRHIARVAVDVLDIQVPADRNMTADARDKDRPAASAGPNPNLARTLIIDELVATNGTLVIFPADRNKTPRTWAIHPLRMTQVAVSGAIPFVATIQNAVPPGRIEASGTFGPWTSEDPGLTPLSGRFTFDHADLSVFKGVSGLLSARGTFGGSLGRIDIHGEADVPDFTLAVGGHSIPLHAIYRAVVDGTNGDTMLPEIKASFLRTTVLASGGVVGSRGIKGRTVTLDVTIDDGRIDDVMRLAVDTRQPPMVGLLAIRTRFLLPPGDRDVAEKLELNGRFSISNARFTDDEVQANINNLSQRGSGLVDAPSGVHVASRFEGSFKLANGQLAIPGLTFDVPGAAIRLSGNYGLLSQQIGFAGMAYTDATISQMTSGWKRLLLKPADLIFKKDGGGAAIPIKIGGSRASPTFGLDKSRVFKRSR